MTREIKTKRVLFFVTVIAIVLLPFTFEANVMQNIITHVSIVIVLGFASFLTFKDCTKKEFETITGLNIFGEE